MKILKALYENPQGLGHNELRFDQNIHDKTLRLWIPKLKREGLVNIEKRTVVVRGGKQNLHLITKKGFDFYERFGTPREVWKDFEKFDSFPDDKKIEILSRMFKIVFERSRNFFIHGETGLFIKLRNSIEDSVRAVLNGTEILQYANAPKEAQMRTPNEYLDLVLRLEPLLYRFIVNDAHVAWDLGHYLNRHHRFFLQKLTFHTEEEIKRRNEEWLDKHNGYNISRVNQEIEERKEFYRQKFPDLLRFIPNDYGNWYGDTH